MSRAEKVAEAQRLRAQGLKLREIAERMGAKRSTVHAWISDPDLSKHRARKARYSRPCVDCGKPTDGSGGHADPRTRCKDCNLRHQHETRHWTREAIIEAFQRFYAEVGRAPHGADINPWHAKAVNLRDAPERMERFYRLGLPPAMCVSREFGSHNAAVEAAGFEPVPRGKRGRPPKARAA